MSPRLLTLREINRATLARQMLLQRADLAVPAALERLIGLQAQAALAPYVGLWTRLPDFRRADLASLIENHTVIKATLMRATLHLMTAADYLRFRATLQPALSSGADDIVQRRDADFDLAEILSAAKAFIAEKPRTFAEISTMLAALKPQVDIGAMRYSVRTHLPLIQVPISTGWSYPGKPQFTLAEDWLGQPIPAEDHLADLVRRYLAAFGPATVTDMQTWSGLPKLKDIFEKLRPELVTYRDEQKRELFDLPDMLIPSEDTPAPVRFLPEYDNLLLSYQKRTRIVADEYRKQVFLPGLRVRSTLLIDGFVQGGWQIEKSKSAATLIMEPFAPITQQQRDELSAEGERLLRFVEADAKTYDIRFA